MVAFTSIGRAGHAEMTRAKSGSVEPVGAIVGILGAAGAAASAF